MKGNKIAIILGYALAGWALCGATMGIGMAVTSLSNAIIIHAILAPIFFAGLSLLYFRKFNFTSPLQTALIFTGFVIGMDFFLVALVINRSLDMFTSLLGTWIPFVSIFLATLGMGILVRRGTPKPGPHRTIYHAMKPMNVRMAANYQKGIGPTRMTLLLTTTGRKSGLPRVTPLQYEEVNGIIYVGSARGPQADWVKNICANPHVHVQVGQQQFDTVAEVISDPARQADFYELRLCRHPIMMRLILHLIDRLPLHHTRADMEALCKSKVLVVFQVVI